jgi:hypothetical protein
MSNSYGTLGMPKKHEEPPIARFNEATGGIEVDEVATEIRKALRQPMRYTPGSAKLTKVETSTMRKVVRGTN